MKRLILLTMLVVLYSHIAFAQEPAVVSGKRPGWHKIGEVKADFKTESESITVLGAGAADEFKAIKLKITDAPIDINKVTVYYESGETQEIPVSGMLLVGAETEEYALERPSDELKKISFNYKSAPNYRGEKAHVELYGLK